MGVPDSKEITSMTGTGCMVVIALIVIIGILLFTLGYWMGVT